MWISGHRTGGPCREPRGREDRLADRGIGCKRRTGGGKGRPAHMTRVPSHRSCRPSHRSARSFIFDFRTIPPVVSFFFLPSRPRWRQRMPQSIRAAGLLHILLQSGVRKGRWRRDCVSAKKISMSRQFYAFSGILVHFLAFIEFSCIFRYISLDLAPFHTPPSEQMP